jgi:hypothetical protein
VEKRKASRTGGRIETGLQQSSWCYAVDQSGVRCCHPAGAVELSPAQVARYASLGLKRGMPDLFIFFEGLWGIELKRRGGAPSKTRVVRTRRGSPRVLVGQEETFPALIASGGFQDIGIAHSVEEMLELCRYWEIPLLGQVS